MEPQVSVPVFTDAKVWYKSRTMVGSIVAVVALAINALGFDIDVAFQNEIADTVVNLAGIAGGAVALYGRVLATKVLAAR